MQQKIRKQITKIIEFRSINIGIYWEKEKKDPEEEDTEVEEEESEAA